MNRSKGHTLIELLAVLSACAMIFSVAGSLIHRTMRAQSQTRYFFENERGGERLARQFRRDVHDAASADVNDDALNVVDSTDAFLRLTRPGASASANVIEYRRHGADIERTLVREEVATSRERFPLATISQITLREDTEAHLLVLTVEADPADLVPQLGKPAPTIHDSPVNFQVIARVGRDADFATPTDAAEESAP